MASPLKGLNSYHPNVPMFPKKGPKFGHFRNFQLTTTKLVGAEQNKNNNHLLQSSKKKANNLKISTLT
jgi:hypothetical protein